LHTCYKQVVQDLKTQGTEGAKNRWLSLVEAEDSTRVQHLSQAYDDITLWFDGRFRNDGTTPAVSHSLFLPVLLNLCHEGDERARLTAIYHDVIEDTQAKGEDLENRSYGFDLVEAVGFLTENKLLSKISISGLSNRV